MAIDTIGPTDTGLQARTKLNQAITQINAGGGGGGVAFSGAQASLASSIVSPTPPYAIAWDTEVYDTETWYSAGQPSRMTVPAGVTRVRLTAVVSLTTTAPDHLLVIITKNGVVTLASPGIVSIDEETAGFAAHQVTFSTPAVPVVEGDYFEVVVYSSTLGVIDTVQSEVSNFSIEKVS